MVTAMVAINGRPGKCEGSPVVGEKFGQEFYTTTAEMAGMLRCLADEIESRGRVEACTADWTLAVSPREPLKLEVQYKPNPAMREIEFQIKLKENP
jgi:amphi-Trp domain-containing protein